jgi:hypothetical protein
MTDKHRDYSEEQLEKETGVERHREEFAEETAPVGRRFVPSAERPNRTESDREHDAANVRMIGWVALAISILSWFFWPSILGPIGAVVGFVAYRGGSRALGLWSMVLGLISLVVYFIVLPYYS